MKDEMPDGGRRDFTLIVKDEIGHEVLRVKPSQGGRSQSYCLKAVPVVRTPPLSIVNSYNAVWGPSR